MLSEARARTLITPHEKRLATCFHAAWQDYLDHHGQLRHRYSPRSQSSIIRDYILLQVRQQFVEVPGARLLSVRGLEVLDISGQVIIRFNKLDKRRRASHSPTQQAFQFIHQLEIPDLPPAATKLQAGYQLNELRTGFTAVWIVCPNGRATPHYSWRLDGPTIMEVPVTPDVDVDESARRVNPKAGTTSRKAGDVSN